MQRCPLVEATKADEVMAVTAIYDHEARKRSYSLLAEPSAWGKGGGGLPPSFRGDAQREPQMMQLHIGNLEIPGLVPQTVGAAE